MELERFKSKLSKSQLKNMAIDTVRKYMETSNPLDILTFAKKLLLFSTTLVKEAEDESKMVWDKDKNDYPDMNYTQGGAIYNWEEDPVYNSIKIMLADRVELLKTAVRVKDPIFDNEGCEVPKVSIKTYRKDSINVKI